MGLEPAGELQASSMGGVDRLTLRAAAAAIAARTPKLAQPVRAPARQRARAVELTGEVSALEFVHLDDVILPRRHFLRQLQRERRRADRSKSPLSIAVFRYAGARDGEFRRVAELLSFFRSTARQTDILGDLGDGTIALMLPDTSSDGTQQFARKIIGRLNELGFTSTTATYPNDLFAGLLAGTESLAQDHQHQLLIDRPKAPDNLGLLVKRSMDVVSAASAIVLLSPLMLVTATAIKLTSPGPIIYRQTRLGKGGVPFTFYKFRSMGCNLDDGVHREYVVGLIREGQRQDGDGNTPRPWAKLRCGFPYHAGGAIHPPDEHRRASAALQCTQGRLESDRTPSCAAL